MLINCNAKARTFGTTQAVMGKIRTNFSTYWHVSILSGDAACKNLFNGVIEGLPKKVFRKHTPNLTLERCPRIIERTQKEITSQTD